MGPWVWLAAALVGFALLQVGLYRYFQGEGPSSDRTSTHGSPDAGPEPGMSLLEVSEDPSDENRIRDDSDESDGSRCIHCGTRNEADPVYTYCRQCGEPLR